MKPETGNISFPVPVPVSGFSAGRVAHRSNCIKNVNIFVFHKLCSKNDGLGHN